MLEMMEVFLINICYVDHRIVFMYEWLDYILLIHYFNGLQP